MVPLTLNKGFALEIPAGFGSQKSGDRSQKWNGGEVFTGQDRGIVAAVLFRNGRQRI
jgi:hypothetical protein